MSEKEFKKVYETYCENLGQAPDSVRDSYKAMHDAFEEYLCTLEEWAFRTAFEFGQNYTVASGMGKAV